jgi:hypothetical protein
MTGSGVQVIGLAGPDGSGKSTTVRIVRERLSADGVAVSSTYGYGCFMCRRLPPRAEARDGRAGGSRHALWVRAHALVDAIELGARLLAAGQRARARARRRRARGNGRPVPRIVVTDRSPLDGLVKYDLPPGALASRCFMALARRYCAIVVLDAPAEVLAARDAEHPADQLERARARFARWRTRLPNVVALDVTAAPPAQAIVDLLDRARR